MKKQSRAAQRFNRVTQYLGRIARKPWLDPVTNMMTRSLAHLTLATKRGQAQVTVEGITREWLRMFPPEICSIEKVEEETGYGLVHADCSLVGTGDVQACYKLMEYDRALVKKMGGKLLVIESRANPLVKGSCRVAIRKVDDARNDLIPAHLID